MTRVKICGLTRAADAEKALELGADALGFVYDPASPRYVGLDPLIPGLLARLGPYVTTFGVFGVLSFPLPPTSMVQFVEGSYSSPHVRVMRGFDAISPSPGCQGVVLDAYDPQAFGGTGKTVDWELARSFIESCALPVVLAGGLTPSNVLSAIETVQPYGVDVSSGVESSPGAKDWEKMRDFIQAVKAS